MDNRQRSNQRAHERPPPASPFWRALLAIFVLAGLGLLVALLEVPGRQPDLCEQQWKSERRAVTRARPDQSARDLRFVYLRSCAESVNFPDDVYDGSAPASPANAPAARATPAG